MKPARFVTYGLIYSGVLLLVQSFLFADPLTLDFPGIFTFLMGAIFILGGLHRRLSPDVEETQPKEHGVVSYGFALLLVILTILTVGQLFV